LFFYFFIFYAFLLFPDARDLLSRLLELDGRKRATFNEVRVHPFFNNGKKMANADVAKLFPAVPQDSLSTSIITHLKALGFKDQTQLEQRITHDPLSLEYVLYQIYRNNNVK
jgi:hypothetical protein